MEGVGFALEQLPECSWCAHDHDSWQPQGDHWQNLSSATHVEIQVEHEEQEST